MTLSLTLGVEVNSIFVLNRIAMRELTIRIVSQSEIIGQFVKLIVEMPPRFVVSGIVI